MPPEVTPHALLRIARMESLLWSEAAPAWAAGSLARAPWVVVRRARGTGLIPVGVRGARRAERHAAWLHPGQVLESVTPAELAQRRGWRHSERRALVPALAALDAVDALLRAQRLSWGPCGSVGFELASGIATASAASDLDVMIAAATPLPPAQAATLLAALAQLPVRVDAQLEVPRGALALSEYAAASGPLALRTVDGVRLVRDPWDAATPAAA